MESYIQITSEAAAQMMLKGKFNELWFKLDNSIVNSAEYKIDIEKIPKCKFFVKITTDTEEMSE
ncbi:hypothetical protein G5986_001035 [Listeria monocytogenes]|nr:hypothetical protein [Listeria monocytogenes]MBC6148182.1 hypothetical protein [Listeria innocua]